MTFLSKHIADKNGFSLVEVAVAMVLFSSVAMVSGLFLMQFASSKANHYESVALMLAETEMDEVLLHRSYFSDTRILEEGKWRIRRQVSFDRRLIMIEVEVYGARRNEPYVVLKTMRSSL